MKNERLLLDNQYRIMQAIRLLIEVTCNIEDGDMEIVTPENLHEWLLECMENTYPAIDELKRMEQK